MSSIKMVTVAVDAGPYLPRTRATGFWALSTSMYSFSRSKSSTYTQVTNERTVSTSHIYLFAMLEGWFQEKIMPLCNYENKKKNKKQCSDFHKQLP